jgi:hypothetical protein
VDALPLHDGEWVRADWHRSNTLLARASSAGAKSRITCSIPFIQLLAYLGAFGHALGCRSVGDSRGSVLGKDLNRSESI